jgi:hypothetical protein
MSDSPVENMDAPPPVSPELRAKILSDPNVAKIAAELEMPLEEFVNQVGYWMNNPGAEPAFLVVPDDKLKSELGVTAPTQEQLEANVKATVEAIKVGQSPSGFDQAKKQAVALPNTGGEQLTAKSDPDLEDTIKKARFPRKS